MPTARTDLELGTSTLLSKRGMQGSMRPSILSLAAVAFVFILGGVGTVALQGGQESPPAAAEVAAPTARISQTPISQTPADSNLVYFGNGV